MRYTTLLSALCLTGASIAIPIEGATQDVKIVNTCFTRVSAANAAIETGMRTRPNGGSTQEAQRITDNLGGLTQITIEELRTCAREIRRNQASISLVESITLLPSLTSILGQLQRIADGWTSAKPMVMAAGHKQHVLAMLIDASDSVSVVADALISKMGFLEQVVAPIIKNLFVTAIEATVTEYKRP